MCSAIEWTEHMRTAPSSQTRVLIFCPFADDHRQSEGAQADGNLPSEGEAAMDGRPFRVIRQVPLRRARASSFPVRWLVLRSLWVVPVCLLRATVI
jgi:hypothetical protein